MRKKSQYEIGWLVGLIEGDGCFTFDGKYPIVVLKITDLDTAERFAELMETTVSGPYHYEDSQIGPKPYYMSKIAGRRARQFMNSTAHHFSVRRREQIRSLLGGQLDLIAQHSAEDEVSPLTVSGALHQIPLVIGKSFNV